MATITPWRENSPMTYLATFYYRTASGTLEECHIVEASPNLAEFRRRAKETARANGWRLVDCSVCAECEAKRETA